MTIKNGDLPANKLEKVQIEAALIMCEDVYIEFNNEFETVAEMAEEYCVDLELLRFVINTGRAYNMVGVIK
jgi:hypothetical protein